MSFDQDAPGTVGFTQGRDDGQRIELPRWSMLVKVAAEHTHGRLTVIEGRLSAGHPGPPAHVHDGHDETFVLLAGRMRFRIGDGLHTAIPGETVFAGRGLAHGFANPFDEPARYVVLLTPSGYERYFVAVAAHVAATGAMPGPELTSELMARHHTVLAAPLPDPES